MNLFGIGTGELVLILVIALLVLGPERLPEIARLWAKFSRTLSQFTRTWQAFNAQLNAEVNRELNPPAKPSRPPRSPAAGDAVESETSAQTIAPPQLRDAPAEPAAVLEESLAPPQPGDLASPTPTPSADASRHEPE